MVSRYPKSWGEHTIGETAEILGQKLREWWGKLFATPDWVQKDRDYKLRLLEQIPPAPIVTEPVAIPAPEPIPHPAIEHLVTIGRIAVELQAELTFTREQLVLVRSEVSELNDRVIALAERDTPTTTAIATTELPLQRLDWNPDAIPEPEPEPELEPAQPTKKKPYNARSVLVNRLLSEFAEKHPDLEISQLRKQGIQYVKSQTGTACSSSVFGKWHRSRHTS